MIKVVICVRKRDDIDLEEFSRCWLEEHGLLVKSYSKLLGIKKYVQSHTGFREFGALTVEKRGMKAGYDGLAELWWDSLEDLKEGMEASTIFFTEEHEVISLG